MMANDLPPLGVYIHIPWCERKCPYCDFNSHHQKTIDEVGYVTALKEDISSSVGLEQGREVASVFFGGGTPSLFSAKSLIEILQVLGQRFKLASNCEISIEANPSSSEYEKFFDFREGGFNRISIGVQSFVATHLRSLGRVHNPEQAREAVLSAHQAGFKNINIDLIHGLPNQSVVQALGDLLEAISLGVHHLSWYELTIEPNTEFYRRPPILLDDERMTSIVQLGLMTLKDYQYKRYEISAYNLGDHYQCRHNLNYWNYGDYIGFGAGAHSKISRRTEHGGMIVERYKKRQRPQSYMQDWQAKKQQIVDHDELLSDYMLNGMRKIEGFSTQQCMDYTGIPLSVIHEKLQPLQEGGFIKLHKDWVKVLELGINFQNDALMLLD